MKVTYKISPTIYSKDTYEFMEKGKGKISLDFSNYEKETVQILYRRETNGSQERHSRSSDIVVKYAQHKITLVFNCPFGQYTASYIDAPKMVEVMGKINDLEHLELADDMPKKDEYAILEVEFPSEKETVISKNKWILAIENTGEILYNREVNTISKPGLFYAQGKWIRPIENNPEIWEETIFHGVGTIVLSKKEYESRYII